MMMNSCLAKQTRIYPRANRRRRGKRQDREVREANKDLHDCMIRFSPFSCNCIILPLMGCILLLAVPMTLLGTSANDASVSYSLLTVIFLETPVSPLNSMSP